MACAAVPAQAQTRLPGMVQQCHAFSPAETRVERLLRPDFAWNCTDDGWRSGAEASWLRFDLAGWDEERPPRYLALRQGQFAQARLYIVDADGGIAVKQVAARDFEPAAFGPYASTALPPIDRGARQLLVRLERPDLSVMGADARLVAAREEVGVVGAHGYLLSTVLGILVPPFLLSLALFVGLRHRFMLAHAGMAGGMILSLGASNGLFAALFGFDMDALVSLTEIGFVILVVSAAVFVFAFLERTAISLRMRRALIVSAACTAIVSGSIALPLGTERFLPSDLYMLGFLPPIGVIVAVFFRAVRRGSRAVWFLILGWTPAIAAAIDMIASGLALQAERTLGVSAPFYAMAFEILVTGVGVVGRVLAIRSERDDALREKRYLLELAEHDPLTGLLNRRALLARFPQLCEDGFTALALLDLDDFKSINDEFGHALGDAVLIAAAEALAPDRNAVVARMGGEEFLVALRGEDLLHRAERRRQAITQIVMHAVPGLSAPLTASMGVLLFDPVADRSDLDFTQLYSRVDQLLYEAKNAGRNTFAFHILRPFDPLADPGPTRARPNARSDARPVPPLRLVGEEGRQQFVAHADRAAGGAVEHRPVGCRRDDDPARCIAEIDPPPRPGAARRPFDPAARCDLLSGFDIAAVIDLVAHHEPDEARAVLGTRHRIPMRGGDVLDPLHPDGIVDVTHDIDVLGQRGETALETAAHRARPICHRMKANSSAVSWSAWKRPDLPPWPAPILVLSSNSLASVLSSRSRATHLAGSQ